MKHVIRKRFIKSCVLKYFNVVENRKDECVLYRNNFVERLTNRAEI